MEYNDILKKYKLYFLQKRYIAITKRINILQYHIDTIYKKHFIDISSRNSVLGKLFEISRSINTKYNNYINQEFVDDEENILKITQVLEKFEDEVDNNIIFDIIINHDRVVPLDKKIISINKPLEYSVQKINQIISEFGYPSLKELIIFVLEEHNYKLLEVSVRNLINELDDVSVPLSFEFYDVQEQSESFYWRFLDTYENRDNLELSRELWIQNPNIPQNYLKIILYFKVDILSTFIKTCQINYSYLYDKKTKIINSIENKYQNINIKFIK